MPMTRGDGTPREDELPSTLQRSEAKAQRTFGKAYDSAAESHGDGAIARRVGFAALKHTHEKVGDHWEPKDEPGPSDPRAAGSRGAGGETAGGVDTNASKKHLYDVAKRLDVPGRSSMSKDELIEAIQKENASRTRKARD